MTMPHSAPLIEEPSRHRLSSAPNRSLRTTDFDELAAGFPGWGMRLVQLGHGPFQGRVVLAQHGPFQLYEVERNRVVLARGSSPSGSYEFNVIQDRNAGALWRGRALRPGMINIRKPGEPMDHRTAERYRSTGLTVDAEFVQRVATALHGVDAESILRRPFVSSDRERCRSLDRSLRLALGHLAKRNDSVAHRVQPEEFLIEWLSAALGDALPRRFREPPALGPQRRAEVVRQAEEYMLAHLDLRLSLLEICEVVGASERTLFYAFRERTGQSPKAYLKALKLNRLRQDLKEADPRTDSVHELARRWGLDHSGALAADYERQFGELPGQTLRHRT
jgi:AraC family transcriptional regulator, ethanolamine operon transcriptional activator